MNVIWESDEEFHVRAPRNRPYVILSAAMTPDGKIATKNLDSKISCPKDLQRVHELRASIDAVMIGIGTVLTDDPRLTVRLVKGKNPIRVIVDSNARTPRNAKVLTEDKDAPTIIAVTEKAPREGINALRSRGAEVIVNSGKNVNLKSLMRRLHERGVKALMLEGGGTLNWSMLKEGLVDEVQVAVTPIIVGGKGAITLVEGEGVTSVSEGIKLKLKRIEQCGEDLVLTYQVLTRLQRR